MFGRLFQRDSNYYRQRGERHLAAERFADARHDFEEALARLGDTATTAERAELATALATAKNALAQLNLDEAEYALGTGESQRAADHLEMVLTLADDVTLREKAENLLNTLTVDEHLPTARHGGKEHGSHCGSCAPQPQPAATDEEFPASELVGIERFELAIVTLPGDLPGRYAQLGEEFAQAYLLALDGDFAGAERTYRRLLTQMPGDILLCELAIALCHQQQPAEASSLLRQALALRPDNPLANLSLVQLLIGTGQNDAARQHLELQIAQGHAVEQARLLLGDLLIEQGEAPAALTTLQPLLATVHGKEAARRLVPLLIQAGRNDEAAGLVKRYLQGC